MQLELDNTLARVNQMLLKDLEHGHFVTLFLARLNPDHRSLSYAVLATFQVSYSSSRGK
jgi:serine phosphatase RsbU (regulator of sigma subunit)